MNKVCEGISIEKNLRCTMNTKDRTVTHSKAPTIHFLETACKQQRHDRFMKFKRQLKNKKLKSGNKNASCKEDKPSVISVTQRAGFPVNFTNKHI